MDYGPRGAGQLDELVRVQRVKTLVRDSRPNPEYEDIVPGGTAQNIADSLRYASVVVKDGDTDQEYVQLQGEVTRRMYQVRMRHEPDISTHSRLVWRGVFLYVQAVDHQTERRSGGGYSVLTCVHNGDEKSETLPGGSVSGGPTPNSSGEISVNPIE